MTHQELIDQLEPLIDATSLSNVIMALACVCYEKSVHVRENWQDNNTALMWNRNAKKIDKLSAKIEPTY